SGFHYSSLNILNLLPHLLDQHFQLHRCLGSLRIHGFTTQRIRLTVQLLHQEIKAPPAGTAFIQRAAHSLTCAIRRSISSATSIFCASSTTSCSRRCGSALATTSSTRFFSFSRSLSRMAAHILPTDKR